RELLGEAGLAVTEARNGIEALEEVDGAAQGGRPFRLAVLDWKMPGLDGLETAARLAQGEDPPKIILVTAYESHDVEARALEVGITSVLHKPVSPSTLHDAVVHAFAPGATLRRRERRDPAGRFAAGQHVLLVEDHPVNRELARELLGEAGLAVTEARNGIEALEALDVRRFDAVLMDVQMPEMDGLEAVRIIRTRPKLRELAVIAMTAHAMVGDRERFIESGMSDYVSKPIEEDELYRVLTRWLRVHDAPARSSASGRTPVSPALAGLPVSAPGLDVAAGLRRTAGNPELYRRLVNGLLDDLTGVVARLNEIFARGDRAEALHVLHTLKGTSATVGAVRVAAAAAGLEVAMKLPTSPFPDLQELSAAVAESIRGVEEITRTEAGAGAMTSPSLASVAPLGSERAAGALVIARRLAEDVASNNLAASSTFAELEALLDGSLHEPLRALEDSLARVDFDEAATHLVSVTSALTLASTQPEET
ncbi:MAG: response regulator, partial [Thermoanaerobaculia bacterium]